MPEPAMGVYAIRPRGPVMPPRKRTPGTTPTEGATSKGGQRTWEDRLPEYLRNPDLYYTRDEVLGVLRDRGIDVDEVALVYWEKAGILPRAVRRWRDGVPRALYPPWAVDAIAHLRELQAKGRKLSDIAKVMPAWELAPIVWQDPYAAPLNSARAALLELAKVVGVDAAGIRVVFTDDEGQEVWTHELPVPSEWRRQPTRPTSE